VRRLRNSGRERPTLADSLSLLPANDPPKAAALITETVVTLAMGVMLYRRRGIDLLPRLSDLQEQAVSLSYFSQRNYERVRG